LYGNNAAFRCPKCNKVFLVSGVVNRRGRECPVCGGSTGFVARGDDGAWRAYLEI
jgi:uncharacterized protein (DUF983 family)